MRAIWITRAGGPEVLEVREAPDPEPRHGEIRVRVRASGLNFADIAARMGMYPDMPKIPCVVGYEAAGIVDKVGPGVTRHKVGARVIVMKQFGAHADVVCVPERQALEMPDEMRFEEGAALPVVYLTAHHILFRVAPIRPGSHVLIHAAAGGVGLAALQLCKTVEGVVTYGTASSSKHEFLKEAGLDHAIDYRSKDYADEIRRLTRGKGVHVVMDPLGGGDWKKGYDLLRPAGTLVCYGWSNMQSGETRQVFHIAREAARLPVFTPLGLMDKNRGVSGVNVGHLWDHIDLLEDQLDAVIKHYRAGKVKPHIDSIFRFDQAGDAQRRMQERRNVGKVILVP